MHSWLLSELTEELDSLHRLGRLRSLSPPTPDGRTLVSFSSNDYLGLADHPRVAEAAALAARRAGVGAGASRLASGDRAEHGQLEQALARFLGAESALVFPSGYQANLGAFSALAAREDLIVSDARNHASLIDGCRLCRAEVAVYPHLDARAAAAALRAKAPGRRRKFIVTESLFSMDGDLAPLAELAELAARQRAVLVVDEAHALGVLGPEGRGLCRASGIEADVLVGTLGKAFGAAGGFVAGRSAMREILVNRARTFIFTTALAPPLAAAASAALDLVRGPEGEARRVSLSRNVRRLRDRLGLPASESPIVPFVLGSDTAAVAASMALFSRGLLVPAIRPPTVAEGSARLRITLSARHGPEDIDALVAALRNLN